MSVTDTSILSTAISKRRLLQGVSGLVAAGVLPSWRRAEAASGYDVIVIGAGTAGMPTAIFAAEKGAKVLVIERASVLGGTLDRSTGQMAAAGTVFQKAKGIADTPDAHFNDNMRINNYTADPALTRLFVDNAADTLNWLAANGFQVLANHPVLGGGHEPFTTARYQWGEKGGRTILATMEPMFQKAVGSGKITVKLSTGVIDLIQDAKGAVVGVVTEDDNGVRADYTARNVVIASGGCASNPRMFEELHGSPMYCDVANPNSQGMGLLLGVAAGGYIRNGDKYQPLFGTVLRDDFVPSPQEEGAGYAHNPERRPPHEILVNARGQRFIREDNPSVDAAEKAVHAQPGQRQWAVADDDMLQKFPPFLPNYKGDKFKAAVNKHPMFAMGQNLHELAVRAGINPQGLARTVADYNAAIAANAPDPFGRIHRPAQIAKGPFYAVRLTGWTVISFAGLAVDGGLRVIRPDGAPIPNLYAAGEVLGGGATSGKAYTNGSMVTPALTFGRLLGSRIMKYQA